MYVAPNMSSLTAISPKRMPQRILFAYINTYNHLKKD